MQKDRMRNGPPGAISNCSKNGWIDENLFVSWLEHFQVFVKSSIEDPVLLIVDNHSTHCTLQAFNFCKRHGILMLTIPPHTSHRLQPLDVTFYKSLKTAYNSECDKYLKIHPGEKITPNLLAELFNNAYSRVATPEKAIKGFEVAGIFPYNPDVFSDEDFVPAETLAKENIAAGQNVENLNVGRSESPECRQRENYLVATPKKATNNQEVTQTSFADILQLPSCSKIGQNSNKVTKPREKQHSDIFTSTPNKCALEEKESKKKAKLEKQKSQSIAKVCKRKVFEENKNEKRPETKRKCKANKNIYELSDDSDKYESEDEVNADICLICGEFGKNKELWLRCNICNQWAHAACAGKGRKELFVCDFCE